MAVYASNKWGDTDSNNKACIGLWFYETGNTATSYTFRADAWIWTKWAIHDSDNNWYWDRKRGSAPAAETQYASRDIYTTVSSGSGWSDSNQQKIDSGSYTYTKEHSWYYIYIRIYLSGVAGCGAMAHNGWVGIPPKDSYAVSYNANNGSGAPSAQTKWYGETLKLQTSIPTRTGYTFKGWATSPSGSVAYAAGANYTGNAKLTLYAVWQINTWAVTYNANGGSGAPASQTKTYGVTLKLQTGTPTFSGYSFNGWNTNSSGTGTNYAAGANYTTNAALALYAKWIHTITYNANGGSGAPATQTANKGTNLAVSSTVLTRSGYTFEGWHANSVSGTKYNAGTNVGTNLALVAKWLQNYTITYNANGGSGAPSAQTKVETQTLTLSSVVPVWENHTFHGWQDSNDSTVIYAPTGSYTADRGATLTAIWTEDYIKPTIGKVTAYRCNDNGVLDDEGTKGFITFDWSVDTSIYSDNIGTSVEISYKQRGTTGDPIPITGIDELPAQSSGTFSFITGSIFNTDYTYDLFFTLNDDGHGSQQASSFISLAYYIVDFKNGGHGIGFGGTADEDLMKVYMESKFVGAVGGDGFKAALLDYVYPIGSIYMSVNNVNPGTFLGGNWQQLENTFLLAAGSSYAAGSTGGAATFDYTPGGSIGNTTLTAAQSGVPAHSHGHSLSAASQTLTGDVSPYGDTGLLSGNYKVSGVFAKGANTYSSYKLGYASGSSYSLKFNSSHGHSLSGSISNNTAANASSGHNHSWTGTKATLNNMPPYLAVYMWKRIG